MNANITGLRVTWQHIFCKPNGPWCWERLKAGGEGDDRGWDGWMASPTQWTWVWVNSGSWWWTGRPGMLQSMGSQRVRHDWATELNWTELNGPWWSRKWQPTTVLLPGESHGQKTLAGYSPQVCKDSDMTSDSDNDKHTCMNAMPWSS